MGFILIHVEVRLSLNCDKFSNFFFFFFVGTGVHGSLDLIWVYPFGLFMIDQSKQVLIRGRVIKGESERKMGSEIGIKIRKIVVISIRGGYRSVCNHPFLVGVFCFLILLYRSFPFLFSVLVSASPVLVCTAILLGTLLSFGQPNVPEVEIEEKVTHDISSFQAGFSEGDTVFADRDESYFVKGYSENRSDVEERGIEAIGHVRHKNLVRLLGYCIEGTHR